MLNIVPATPEWEPETIRKGIESFSRLLPVRANPPSAEFLQAQQARQALCSLGTPDAVRALTRLLAHNAAADVDARGCLSRTSARDEAIEEMRSLIADPEAAINVRFFDALVRLLGRGGPRNGLWSDTYRRTSPLSGRG